ncbi:hypothetical protein E5676_scaffold1737G00490 [Cucumis melo var. makuwa]|uniref:Uncharacterized protein n=1 Tax=Cucumis melo var. makuwa TaxID=1194695 RepID=A0A5D3C770_CUCMM|nr:hypothetical protein E5676_scaffold1737G00490 [Cucumis melo var. makuwa]
MNFSSRIRGFFNLHLSNLDQHVLGAPSGHRRPDFRSYGSACCTCSGTCQRLGEGKGRGKLASDREGSVTCHMGTQFCFRVYAEKKLWSEEVENYKGKLIVYLLHSSLRSIV